MGPWRPAPRAVTETHVLCCQRTRLMAAAPGRPPNLCRECHAIWSEAAITGLSVLDCGPTSARSLTEQPFNSGLTFMRPVCRGHEMQLALAPGRRGGRGGSQGAGGAGVWEGQGSFQPVTRHCCHTPGLGHCVQQGSSLAWDPERAHREPARGFEQVTGRRLLGHSSPKDEGQAELIWPALLGPVP